MDPAKVIESNRAEPQLKTGKSLCVESWPPSGLDGNTRSSRPVDDGAALTPLEIQLSGLLQLEFAPRPAPGASPATPAPESGGAACGKC